jgi:hypothetical protein
MQPETLKASDNLGNLSVDGMTILKFNSEKMSEDVA